MDPVTKVPTKAAWISTVIGAIASGCLDLDELATLSSIGILITYALIEVAVIQKRIRSSTLTIKSQWSKTQKLLYTYSPGIFFVISFMSAFSISLNCSKNIITVFGVIIGLVYLVLQYLLN